MVKIKQTELLEEFTQWYNSTYGNRDKPKPKDLYAYVNKNYCKKLSRNPGKVYRLLYENDLED